MKPIAVFATLAPLLGACAVPLATLPPSDTYAIVESPAPELTPDEQRLVADINKELDRLGLPVATVGGYESNAAAVLANVALAKIWNGSGRTFATNQDVAAPASSATEQVVANHKTSPSRVNSLTDEENDAELKHLHADQHQISYGIPPLRAWLFSTPHAKTALESDDIKKLVGVLHPNEVRGDLKLGVAILPAGDADARIWAITIQDHTFDLTMGPPRTIAPGGSFEIAGSVADKKLTVFTAAILGPDGKTQLTQLPVDEHGKFAATFTLPTAPGIYQFELVRLRGWSPIVVPIFAGLDPTPWPASADPKATPVTGTRTLAQRMAKLLADFRNLHGLAAVPIDADLSAFSKTEATALAKLVDDSSGPGSSLAIQDFFDGNETRMHAAGFDKLKWWQDVLSDDYLNKYFAEFPGRPSFAADLASPTAQAFGVGVALVPNKVTKDDDLTRYAIVWTVKDPTPPEPQVAKSAEPPPPAKPDGQTPAPVAAPVPTPDAAPAPVPAPGT